ncbi:MAG: hypothetical protein RL189_519 [Pseudomonadota bacterium]|jgi:hypothetical protein
MSGATNDVQEHSQGDVPRWLLPVRELIFGKQNERIEYFMDSYFKLPSEGRTAVIAGAFIFAGLVVFTFIGLYLSALSSLQAKLDGSFQAMNKLRAKQVEYAVTKKKFDELDRRIGNVTGSLQILSLLEDKAKSLDLQISGNTKTDKGSNEKDFIRGTPLADKYKSTRSEFRVSNVSLKKIIDLVVAIESDDKMLRVSDLRIKGLYQNKLFFDATFAVDGIEPKK